MGHYDQTCYSCEATFPAYNFEKHCSERCANDPTGGSYSCGGCNEPVVFGKCERYNDGDVLSPCCSQHVVDNTDGSTVWGDS